jgi:acid phosphatase type 7
MAKKKAQPAARKPTTLTVQNLRAAQQNRLRSPRGRHYSPSPVPPGFHTVVDPSTHPLQPWRDLPAPTGTAPFRMNIASILDAQAMQSIQNKLVFHAVGDTGGVNTPTYIEGVARFMECDYTYSQPPDRPSFFYHLGDVVYYDGESANYWLEFYEPYLNYPAPIVAIPGNHDGDVNPSTGESSLEAFMRNFCAQAAVFSPDNREAPRQTMTQPNVYWTLNTPLVTIVGLYSNCPEGGQIGSPQQTWFVSELKDADPKLPLIVAVHHPIYSAYGPHPGSQHLKDFLEQSCATAGRSPDLVLTGHVHDYQRFSAPLPGKPKVPFMVAGAGGYNQRLHTLSKVFHQEKLPINIQGSDGVLEAFNDSQHGYLRITVTKGAITAEYVAVADPSAGVKDGVLPAYDSVTVKTV